jgi:Fe-S-cluster containining protein
LANITLPQLPSMRCDDGCGLCCGINFIRNHEYRRIEGLVRIRGIKPLRQGTRCPLYIEGKCSIYEGRPLVCKLFGHVEQLNCPRGYNVNIPKDQQVIWRQQIAEGSGIRSIHELVYTASEMPAIIEQAKQEG